MANYDNNIVNGPDLLSQSQPDMLSNFKALDDLINVNHIGFNNADEGKHKFVTFPRSRRGVINPLTDKVVNSQLDAFTNVSEIIFANAAGAGFMQTEHNIPFSQPMWSILSNAGITVKTITVAAVRGPMRILFPIGNGIRNFTNVFNVQLTIQSAGLGANNGNAYVTNFDNLGVDVQVYSNVAGNVNPFGFFIMAIGIVGPTF